MEFLKIMELKRNFKMTYPTSLTLYVGKASKGQAGNKTDATQLTGNRTRIRNQALNSRGSTLPTAHSEECRVRYGVTVRLLERALELESQIPTLSLNGCVTFSK
jgi:hypothetical protein